MSITFLNVEFVNENDIIKYLNNNYTRKDDLFWYGKNNECIDFMHLVKTNTKGKILDTYVLTITHTLLLNNK
jgi:hypothetical protein